MQSSVKAQRLESAPHGIPFLKPPSSYRLSSLQSMMTNCSSVVWHSKAPNKEVKLHRSSDLRVLMEDRFVKASLGVERFSKLLSFKISKDERF